MLIIGANASIQIESGIENPMPGPSEPLWGNVCLGRGARASGRSLDPVRM